MNTLTNSIYIAKSEHSKEPELMIQYANVRDNHELFFHFTRKKNIPFFNESVSENLFSIELTEKNLIELVEYVWSINKNFTIDPQILEHYQTIKSWRKDQIQKQFSLHDSCSFYNDLIEDIGIENINNTVIIRDRSNRYQYFVEKNQLPTNLTEQIAFRKRNTEWINSEIFSLTQLIDSLITLKRLPILFVFNQHSTNNFLELLQEISSNLIAHEINKIGVYFRLANDQTHRTFNEFIAQNNYNQLLTSDIDVAMIRNGKLPKFLFKSKWSPKSVVFLEHGIVNNKTTVYANNISDLILVYSKTKPLSLDL